MCWYAYVCVWCECVCTYLFNWQYLLIIISLMFLCICWVSLFISTSWDILKLTWPMPFWQHIKTTMTTVHPFCWNVVVIIIIIISFPFLWNSEKDETIPFYSCSKDSKLFLNALAFNLVMKSLHFDDEFKTVLRKISVKV